MLDFLLRRRTSVGQPPGTLVYVGPDKDFTARFDHLRYGPGTLDVLCAPCSQTSPETDSAAVDWLRVRGVHDPGVVEDLGRRFGLSPLVLEDVLNTGQRPKLEEFEDYLFLTAKSVAFEAATLSIVEQHLCLVLRRETLISFEEGESATPFDAVRARLDKPASRLRRLGASYLAVALLDAAADSYFLALSDMAGKVQDIEDTLMDAMSEKTLISIYRLKRAATHLRNTLWPFSEVAAGLSRLEDFEPDETTRAYLRDVADHLQQSLDFVSALHDMLSGMLDVYVSLSGMRMNQVMKTLTVIATIFIPLTFVAGVYGMNFEFMPELSLGWGYPAALGLMAAIAAAMLVYFFRKKWF